MSEHAEPWTRWSNHGVADREKFGLFVDAICGTFTGIRPERMSARPFEATFTALRLPGVELAHIAAPGHRAHRDRSLISRKPDDSIFVNFEPGRAYRARLGGEAQTVAPGAALVLDNGAGFDLEFNPEAPMSLFSLRLPRASLPCEISGGRLPEINRRASAGETGRALGRQFALLARAFERGDARLCEAMAPAVRELLRSLVDGRPPDEGVLAAIKNAALPHIVDPSFTISRLAALLDSSVRTVQSRFAEAGETFSGWLLAARLDHADRLLGDPVCRFRTISRIAFESGFSDIPHFNRAYRARFGAAPGARR